MSTELDFTGWAFLDLMGHRRLAGMVSGVSLCGTPMIRIDMPRQVAEDEPIDVLNMVTQFYAPSALYCLTPSTEDRVRAWHTERTAWERRTSGELEGVVVGDDDEFDEDVA